jgi:hypothetical protein
MNFVILYKNISTSFAGHKMLRGSCDMLSFINNLDTKKSVVNFRPTYFVQEKTLLLLMNRSRSRRFGESEIEPSFLIV